MQSIGETLAHKGKLLSRHFCPPVVASGNGGKGFDENSGFTRGKLKLVVRSRPRNRKRGDPRPDSGISSRFQGDPGEGGNVLS